MKYIRLEYDKKLCKEKLEKNKKSARQRFLQKICIVICGTGVYFLLLSAILFTYVFIGKFAKNTIFFDAMFVLSATIMIFNKDSIIFKIERLSERKKIEDRNLIYISEIENIRKNAQFARTEYGEWLIYTQIDNEEKWMPLKKIFDYYRIYYDDIPDEWNSLTLKFYNDARGTAYFS